MVFQSSSAVRAEVVVDDDILGEPRMAIWSREKSSAVSETERRMLELAGGSWTVQARSSKSQPRISLDVSHTPLPLLSFFSATQSPPMWPVMSSGG